ncbi:Anoctamin-7 [Nymphon striatum]|nr:Anoctamin-7 [Nymphon striatum]
MSIRQNAQSAKSPVGKLSSSAKSPFGKLSVDQTSFGKGSFGKMSVGKMSVGKREATPLNPRLLFQSRTPSEDSMTPGRYKEKYELNHNPDSKDYGSLRPDMNQKNENYKSTDNILGISLNGKSLVDAKIRRSRQVLTLAAQSKESVTKIEPLYAVDSTVLFMRMSVLLERSVVFDGYSDGPSVKDHEHNLRIMTSGGYAHIQIEHHAKVLSNQHGFLANDGNKSKLIDQLTLRTKINDVIRINADACIYCNCFGSLWDIAVCGANVIVVSNDTDVKIMLLYLYNSEMGDIIVKPFGSKKSGCDATSAIFEQGKTSIIKLVENSKKARNFCDISMSSDSTVKEVGDPGIGLLVLMYSGRENDTLSHLRFVNYMRMTATSKKQLQPEKLPPTKQAAWFHNLRVYHQICHWKSLKDEKDPLEWGWKMEDGKMSPIMTDQKEDDEEDSGFCMPDLSPNKDICFRDGKRKIDYVLAYEEIRKPDKKQKILFARHEKWRQKFLSNLRKVGLDMEEEAVESEKKVTYLIKLSTPWLVLVEYAEDMSIRAPLQIHQNSSENWSDKVLQFFRIPNIMTQTVPNTPPDFYTCVFKKSKLDRFLGSDNHDEYFTTAQRIRITCEILQKTVYGKRRRAEIGIDRLVEEKVYTAAYPLHDGDFRIPPFQLTPELLNKRQVLYQYWARWGQWYKYQPVDHIREYFGEKIGIYFAWLGFYTGWLLPAAIVGFLVFLYGICTMRNDIPSSELCESGPQFKMCPLCEESIGCPYWYLSSTCLYAKISYLFDHPGTVFYAVFVSFWAVSFLEYWKRKNASLAHHWDCLDFEEEEERPRPDFAAKAPLVERNPITGIKEPSFPLTVRLKRMAAGVGVIFLMVDCKQYWISIKSAANYNNNKSRHGLSNNKKIDLDKLNNHFLRFEDNNKHQIPQTCTEPVGDEYPVLDENIIKSLITKLSKSDSPGPDGLTSQTLKIFKHQLHNPVRFILNKCLCLGKIPQSWKKVKIIPIPKGGRKTIKEVADARPIGLTSSFLKLLEHYLKQFVNVLVSDQLDSNQFAYKEHRGTQDAIALLINQTQCFLDEKDTIVRILFLDFSSAFNTVSRQELLDIIKNRFLAPNWLINILLSYLDERIQYVSFGKDKSKEVGCRAGVIQGAVLSPLFFTLVTDSLTSNSNYNNCNVIKYADDTAIIAKVNNSLDIENYQAQINEIVQWSNDHNLYLNVSKTEELIFCNKHFKNKLLTGQIFINGNAITPGECVKYLGVYIDTNLTFSKQVEKITQKVNSRMFYAIKLLRFCREKSVIKDFIFTCILPILTYSLFIYIHFLNQKSIITIKRLIRKLARISGINKTQIISFVEGIVNKNTDTFIKKPHVHDYILDLLDNLKPLEKLRNTHKLPRMTLVMIFIVAVIVYRVLVSIPLFQNKYLSPRAVIIASTSGAIVNLILIMALGRVYEMLAYKLTKWGSNDSSASSSWDGCDSKSKSKKASQTFLPKQNGRQVTTHFRRLSPVIILESGVESENAESQGSQAGAVLAAGPKDVDGAKAREAEEKLMTGVNSSVPVKEILEAWSTIDDDIPIASSILAEENNHEEEEEEEDPVPAAPTRTADDAVKGLEMALEYYERVGDKVKTLQLKSLVRDAKMRASKSKKQADITSYLTRK